jgi:multiple sugar transport system substrate-binding protein
VTQIEGDEKMIKKHMLLFVSILVILSFFIGSCAPAATEAPEEPAVEEPEVEEPEVEEPAEKVELVFWKHNHTPADPLTQEIIDEYMAENPNVSITLEIVPNADHLTKLVSAVAGGVGPDIFDMNDTNLAVFITKDALAPLDPTAIGYASQEEYEALYVENSLNPFKGEDGKIYGIPFEYNSWTFVINDTLFEAAGLNPETDWPKTWEEMGEVAAKVAQKDENGQFSVQGFAWNPLTSGWTMLQYGPIVYQYGGSILSDDDKGNECAVNSEAGVKALQVMKDMYYKYETGAPGINLSTGSEPMADFVQEKMGMWFIGPWSVSMFKDTPVWETYRIVPFPQAKDGVREVVSLSSWAWMVNSQSENVDEAWKFVDYAEQQGERWLPAAGYVLPRKGWTESEAAKNFRGLDTFIELFQYGRPRLSHPNSAEINAIIHKAVEDAILNDADPQTLLDAACEEIDALLE